MEATAKRLLDWYDANARVLPWRAPPGAPPPDPYRVWLSEVMLQQTTVAAVGPYFAKFLARWPTVKDLAAAEDADVMAAWAGLGYYARARNLLACARAVAARGGTFPDSEAALRELPGLGAYTAAAVAAIAFDRRAIVVDANVERVVARLFAIDEPLPAAKAAIRQRAEQLTPDERPGDFAQAMMDLGSGICTVRGPRCLLCPLSELCTGRREGAERFPVKPAKTAKPQRRGRAFWIEQDGKVWLVKRADKGMLGGMRALPDDSWSARGDGAADPPLPDAWEPHGNVRHSFTHFDLDLQLMLYSGCDWARLAAQQGEWWPVAELDQAGLPTLFAKAARLALAQDREN
ncbi:MULTISPECIES: A/G-specific adenine glycosylase [unclassified Novosphingobium]|uniref:A/G-specific adenine glycosylase n=1 Tax=unclassified Novosphingobium TaxID=2644732 RepID=UPI000EDE69BD|nr:MULTISPECIES: A/G-specific adenine glycosylase [unclassified Novosphingobium]HCF24679.1 A/G-specific adenine glycosylase [Novosphingobium sp.]HQV04909.1 A/G-specific adenine glycosylase [Novosphingobium sp.]